MNIEGVASETRDNVGYRAQSRPEMLAFLPDAPNLRVLDIGCGEGAFGVTIPNALEVWGVEPHERAAAVAKTRLHRVFTSLFDIAKTDLPKNYFDLVICNDVIEHMTDHDGFLRSIQDVMAPGATIVGSLPNVRYYANVFDLMVKQEWRYEDSGILDRTHFRFFTLKSIRRSLVDAGFSVVDVRGINNRFSFRWTRWNLAASAFYWFVLAASGGRAADMKYLQIGFRAFRMVPVADTSGQ